MSRCLLVTTTTPARLSELHPLGNTTDMLSLAAGVTAGHSQYVQVGRSSVSTRGSTSRYAASAPITFGTTQETAPGSAGAKGRRQCQATCRLWNPSAAPGAARSDQSPAPPFVSTRSCLERIRRLKRGHYCIGRGSRQRALSWSLLCNGYKVAVYGREEAIRLIAVDLEKDQAKKDLIPGLSGVRLVCRCPPTQACHADINISRYRLLFLGAFDRDASGVSPPTTWSLNRLATLRLAPENEEVSTADEGAPASVLRLDRSTDRGHGLNRQGALRRADVRVARPLAR